MPPVVTCINTFKQSLTGGSFEALAAGTKDSLTVISTANPSVPAAYLEEIFAADNTSKMELEIFSQRFGDNQNGFRTEVSFNAARAGQLLAPRTVDIPVWSADTLNVSVNGTASDNANATLQLYYPDIPGAGQRLATAQFVENIIQQGIAGNSRVLGIEVTVTAGSTGNYGTAIALNANDDRLQADYDYALIGFACDKPVLCFGISGPDTGYYRIPMPGHWDARWTSDWFLQQSRWRNIPHVPVINANNKATTFLDGIDPGNPGAVKLALYLAQLPTRYPGNPG